jgi:hypothetical protein
VPPLESIVCEIVGVFWFVTKSIRPCVTGLEGFGVESEFVGFAVGLDDENGVFEIEGNPVGDGLAFGFPRLNTPEKKSAGIRRITMSVMAIAVIKVRDFFGFGGGGGGGYCIVKWSLLPKFSLNICSVLFAEKHELIFV